MDVNIIETRHDRNLLPYRTFPDIHKNPLNAKYNHFHQKFVYNEQCRPLFSKINVLFFKCHF